jgi:catechol 2,3-dioxygenase-like lactoylglutathione lyase family enzyme
MITGAHALLYSNDAEKDREFMRDVLGFKGVDAGEGWLIFALPPAEVGVHPADDNAGHTELYLMCDDVDATITDLRAKGVECTEPQDQGWGILTNITLPSGGKLGMYQPRHATAI